MRLNSNQSKGSAEAQGGGLTGFTEAINEAFPKTEIQEVYYPTDT